MNDALVLESFVHCENGSAAAIKFHQSILFQVLFTLIFFFISVSIFIQVFLFHTALIVQHWLQSVQSQQTGDFEQQSLISSAVFMQLSSIQTVIQSGINFYSAPHRDSLWPITES
jgi:hypothetical protein